MCSFSNWVRTSTVPMRSIVQPGTTPESFRAELAGDQVVEGVAFVRLAAGSGDQAADRGRGHDLGCIRPGHVVNPLLLDGAVQVVRAEPQRGLRHADAGCDPE